LRLCGAAHDADFVNLEEGLEKICSADLKQALDFIVAGILPETLIVEVSLVHLNRRALVAEHELLEVQETQVPRVALLIGEEA
jgi:hypothetical protein